MKFDLLTDIYIYMYLLTEKGIHGGLWVIKHYTDKETFWKWRTTVKISQSKNMKFSIKDFFSKWDSVLLFRFNSVNFFSFLQICSYLLNKSLMQNFFLQWAQPALGVPKCKQIFMNRQWCNLYQRQILNYYKHW